MCQWCIIISPYKLFYIAPIYLNVKGSEKRKILWCIIEIVVASEKGKILWCINKIMVYFYTNEISYINLFRIVL